jgi:hypothetical protein
MKKLTTIALVIGVALMLAVPAMAIDVTWDGYLRVRGFLAEKAPMSDTADDYNAYYDMKWRTNWTLTVNDYLRIRSRWRALNQVGGGDNSDLSNFEIRRAWMLVQTPYGLFEAGKMITKTFGTGFLDSESSIFRINYSTKIADKVVFVATAQKALEGDGDGAGVTGFEQSGDDIDVYGFALVYPTENWSIGSLQVALVNHNNGANSERYSANPYFTGKFGNLALQAEGWIAGGDAGKNAAGDSVDFKEYAFNAEGTYDLGMAALQLGFAYVSGDDDPDDTDYEATPPGDDWEKFYILFGSTGATPAALGSVGNFSDTGGNLNGYMTVYGGASTNLTEQLNVGLSAAWCQVDQPSEDWADDAGVEVDLRVNWTFYDNLTYSVIGSYLFAGDYWKDASESVNGADGNDDDPWALFHAIQLNF